MWKYPRARYIDVNETKFKSHMICWKYMRVRKCLCVKCIFFLESIPATHCGTRHNEWSVQKTVKWFNDHQRSAKINPLVHVFLHQHFVLGLPCHSASISYSSKKVVRNSYLPILLELNYQFYWSSRVVSKIEFNTHLSVSPFQCRTAIHKFTILH